MWDAREAPDDRPGGGADALTSRVGTVALQDWGLAWIVHGLLVPYIGLFPSILRRIALVLMYLWGSSWPSCCRATVAGSRSCAPR
jgi:hypothetical protein